MNGYPKVKGFFVENAIKQKDVATLLGMSLTTFNNKLNGVGDFSMQDVRKMCSEYNIQAELFFRIHVPIKERK